MQQIRSDIFKKLIVTSVTHLDQCRSSALYLKENKLEVTYLDYL